MQRALTRGGLSALDGRSAAARSLKTWKAQVSADLGNDLSAQEQTLLHVAAMDIALLIVADAWLRENAESVVNRRRKTFVPLVRERLTVASHLTETLKHLGLKRVPRPVLSLAEVLRGELDARVDAQEAAGGANRSGAESQAEHVAHDAPTGQEKAEMEIGKTTPGPEAAIHGANIEEPEQGTGGAKHE